MEDGTLAIFGTGRADYIRLDMQRPGSGASTILHLRGHDVSIRGDTDVQPERVVIHAGAGKDRVTVWQQLNRIPVAIHGDQGADRIKLDSPDGFPAVVSGDD